MANQATIEKAGRLQIKSLNVPDERRVFPKGKLDIVTFASASVGKAVLEPGWRWSESVKPIARTESCQAPHFQYQLSGTLRVIMDDGTEKDLRAGDVSLVPPGHDAWVVGSERVVLVDFQGMGEYAKAAGGKK